MSRFVVWEPWVTPEPWGRAAGPPPLTTTLPSCSSLPPASAGPSPLPADALMGLGALGQAAPLIAPLSHPLTRGRVSTAFPGRASPQWLRTSFSPRDGRPGKRTAQGPACPQPGVQGAAPAGTSEGEGPGVSTPPSAPSSLQCGPRSSCKLSLHVLLLDGSAVGVRRAGLGVSVAWLMGSPQRHFCGSIWLGLLGAR